MKRRARSSETVRPLPVRMTKADAFKGTICDRPQDAHPSRTFRDSAREEVGKGEAALVPLSARISVDGPVSFRARKKPSAVRRQLSRFGNDL